jgi:hypothetical protein
MACAAFFLAMKATRKSAPSLGVLHSFEIGAKRKNQIVTALGVDHDFSHHDWTKGSMSFNFLTLESETFPFCDDLLDNAEKGSHRITNDLAME